ncbi:MAG: hypothetical protein ACK50P_02645, partial [Planctomycetaceae bacterium]
MSLLRVNHNGRSPTDASRALRTVLPQQKLRRPALGKLKSWGIVGNFLLSGKQMAACHLRRSRHALFSMH